MSDKMNIVITVNAAWNVFNFRRGLVKSFLDNGHIVTVLAPHDDAVDQLIEMGCIFRDLPMDAKGLSPISSISLVRRFKAAFKEIKPDIVFSYTIKNNIFGAFAARKLGIAFVPNVTGLGTAFLSGGFLQTIAEMLYKEAFKSVKIIFFQNDDDQRLFKERRLISRTPSQILPGSGVNLEEFKPRKKHKPKDQGVRFLMIARLIKDKGVVEYVEAARNITQTHPMATFSLLGGSGDKNRGGIDKETLEAWLSEGLINYIGYVSDVRAYIADADCIVLPSYREGAPRTLIEAAAMGKPLIATNVPGCRGVVDEAINGYLCAPKDSHSLARACEAFIKLSPTERRAMGVQSRLKMENEFDEAIIIKAYHHVLDDITI